MSLPCRRDSRKSVAARQPGVALRQCEAHSSRNQDNFIRSLSDFGLCLILAALLLCAGKTRAFVRRRGFLRLWANREDEQGNGF
jgi:hypothetical protein